MLQKLIPLFSFSNTFMDNHFLYVSCRETNNNIKNKLSQGKLNYRGAIQI